MNVRRFWFGQLVTDSQLDNAVDQVQTAEQAIHVDAGFSGVMTGLVVGPHYVGTTYSPNLSVDVSVGAARDAAGLRIPLTAIANVDCSEDHLGVSTAVSAGNHRCLSIFAKQLVTESEPHSKKAGGTVYRVQTEGTTLEVWMGAQTALANPLDLPALMSGYVLLADVTLVNGQTQIVAGDISTARRQDQVVIAGSPYSSQRGTLLAALGDAFAGLNDLVADLVSAGVGTLGDGASLIGAAIASGSVFSLVAGTVRSQLTAIQQYLDGLRQECSAYRAAVQELTTTATDYPIAFPTEVYDANGMFTPADATGKTVTVDTGTDVWTANSHGYVNGDAVYFTTDGALPTTTPQIVVNQPYYVINKTTHTFKLAENPLGAAIDVTDAGGSTNKTHWTQTKFPFPANGRYRVTVSGKFEAHTDGYRELYLETDGGVVFGRTRLPSVQGGYATYFNVVGAGEFLSTNYVRAWAVQTTAGALDISECLIAIERIG